MKREQQVSGLGRRPAQPQRKSTIELARLNTILPGGWWVAVRELRHVCEWTTMTRIAIAHARFHGTGALDRCACVCCVGLLEKYNYNTTKKSHRMEGAAHLTVLVSNYVTILSPCVRITDYLISSLRNYNTTRTFGHEYTRAYSLTHAHTHIWNSTHAHTH